MNKIFACIGITALIVLCIGCDVGIQVSAFPPVERIEVLQFNASFSDAALVITTPQTPLRMTGLGEARRPLLLRIFPDDAQWGFKWESTDPAVVWFDPVTYQLVGNATGLVMITFSSVGTMANGNHATYEVYVDSSVLNLEKMFRWYFREQPVGWDFNPGNPDATIAPQPAAQYPDFDGKGMPLTLLGTSVQSNLDQVMNSSAGHLRVGRGGHFATVNGVQGPYRVMVEFSRGGGTDQRWAEVQIGATRYNSGGSLANTGSGSGREVLDFIHPGTGSDPIHIHAANGIRVNSVFIELQY